MRWPAGALSSGVSCGIKSGGRADLGVLRFEHAVEWAGVFTQNAAAAAPVRWCRDLLGERVRALVVNSGNANACTGRAGEAATRATASGAAQTLGCRPEEVLVASTGPIGVPLPVDSLIDALPLAFESLSEDCESFARSILTTDTVLKMSAASAGDASVVGVAKGAAMLAPNMATMLAFVVSDARPAGDLSGVLSQAVEPSFNSICVDACESTNDSVFLLASGSRECEEDELAKAVEGVCRDLAEQIVRDAEGGSKFVRILVRGAADDAAARDLGRGVASSALWRAAVNGSDPNWGRVLAALGSRDRMLDLNAVEITIGDAIVFDHGEPAPSLDGAAAVMRGQEFTVECNIGSGPGRAEVLTADLSAEYVALNAEGTT